MSSASIIIFFSLVWLSWRVLQLWSAPLTLVLRHLQIEIPSPPRLTIDALTSDSVSLHWAPPEPHVKKHIIQMDGQEVGISVRGETSVTISGLTSDYLYSIHVIAVNAQGFQVASPSIFVRTRPKGDNEDDEQDEVHEPHLQPHTHATEAITTLPRQPKKRGSMDIHKSKDTSTVPEDSRRVESQELIDDLRSQMDAIKKEMSDVEGQVAQLTEHQAQEEANYHAKLEELRSKKKDEDDAKTAKEQYHKQLDQQRREIETKRNQVQRALKAEQDALQKQSTEVETFSNAIRSSIDMVKHLEGSMKTLQTETDDAVQEARRNGAIAAEELSEIESEIRYLLGRKAESEAELTRLLSASRVPSPSPQEAMENAQNDALWKQREESLAMQYEEVQQRFLRLQNNAFIVQDGRNNGTLPDIGLDHNTQIRRHTSRRGRADDLSRPDSAMRGQVFPAFNPDAAPFVAASPLHSSNDPSPIGAAIGTKSIFSGNEAYNPLSQINPAGQNETMGYAAPRSRAYNQPASQGTTSIFTDEPIHPRISSPFARRDSAKSSQSDSNPPSPAVQTRGGLPSIFNAAPNIGQRNSSGSLVASLNGTPLNESNDPTPGTESSKWFWPMKKVNTDPLALDRLNARSLPKADVAPIGTRRNRSGSLREDRVAQTATSATANGHVDLDLLNDTSLPLSREASLEEDGFSTSATALPRPMNGTAFGWDFPQAAISQRRLPNPWNASESEHIGAASRGFDPFGDMPSSDSPLTSVDKDFLSPPAAYHTTIDASRLPSLNREVSSGSRKSTKSKADSQDSKDRIRRLGETGKFSSFVGRMFNPKKDGKEQAIGDAQDSLEANGTSAD